jgi:DNA repair protein RadC
MTHRIIKAGETMNVTVHDHIIVGRNGHASFKGLKLI